MNRPDYGPHDPAPLAPILVALASIPAAFVIAAVIGIYVVSCWGGR